ncbi:PadR family transcriptional regulator [Candidatus Micrarchaeota archaeon CG1_02_47_40]|nr:MAG: PadR family transcriptional regulator [Candidatus Micrarchaeota archaeon CG1_02_47_40]
MKCCDMKGFLSYLILWCLKKRKMNGTEIAGELEKRKGTKPSPGTIYPALKELKGAGLVGCDARKVYFLTEKGKRELEGACGFFSRMFYDAKEMFGCACGK